MSKKNGDDSKKKLKSNIADDVSRKPSTNNNVLTNGLKRPSTSEFSRYSGRRKKLRTTLNSTGKYDGFTSSRFTEDNHIKKCSKDSNKTRNSGNKKCKSEKIGIINKNKNICNEIGSIKKNPSKINETESVENIIENSSPLKNGPPSSQLVVENSCHKKDINESYTTAVNSPVKTENLNKTNIKQIEMKCIEESYKNDSVLNNGNSNTVTLESSKHIESITVTESSKNIESILVTDSSNHNTIQAVKSVSTKLQINISSKTNQLTDNVGENDDSENSFDFSLNPDDDNYDTQLLEDCLHGLKKIDESQFPVLLRMFAKNKVTYAQFEALCTAKVLEFMTDRYGIGKDRADIKMLILKEQHWRKKYASLAKQIRELKAVVKMHNSELKQNNTAKPHLVQRTVGLQAVIMPKKETTSSIVTSSASSDTININSVTSSTNVVTSSTSTVSTTDVLQQTVDITIDDYDEVLEISNNDNNNVELSSDKDPVEVLSDTDDVIPFSTALTEIPSTSKTFENMSPKKQVQSPSKVYTLSPFVLKKAVPPAVPINSLNKVVVNNSATIDLTHEDKIEISNGYTLNKSPIKIIHSSGSSPKQLPNNVPAQVLPTSIGYLDLSQPSTGFIVRTTTTGTKGSTQLASVSSLNTNNQSNSTPSSPQPFILKDGKLVPFIISTVRPRQIQPSTVTFPAHGTLQPIQHNGTLKPIQPKHNGTLQPVPPAIPILNKHPAPLPPIPIQRTLTTWKKPPPPPKVTITKTTQSQRALVLSWNMPAMGKSYADINSYQIFAYHELDNEAARTDLWKKIGDVNALPLPMACSLTQFKSGEKYHFSIRAVDTYHRIGPFSEPQDVFLTYS